MPPDLDVRHLLTTEEALRTSDDDVVVLPCEPLQWLHGIPLCKRPHIDKMVDSNRTGTARRLRAIHGDV